MSERVSERESGAMALMAASDAIEATQAGQSKATTTPRTLNCSWPLDRNTIIGTIH